MALALLRELVRQATRPGADLIVTETAGRWNVSGPIDVDALARVAASGADCSSAARPVRQETSPAG